MSHHDQSKLQRIFLRHAKVEKVDNRGYYITDNGYWKDSGSYYLHNDGNIYLSVVPVNYSNAFWKDKRSVRCFLKHWLITHGVEDNDYWDIVNTIDGEGDAITHTTEENFLEIERKFLVKNDEWRDDVIDIMQITQFYVDAGDCTVRVRNINNEEAYLTVKLPHDDPATAYEFEKEIPMEALRNIAAKISKFHVSKARHILRDGWVVDCFDFPRKGVVLAEIELNDSSQELILPEWVGEEVTDNPDYYNVNMDKG